MTSRPGAERLAEYLIRRACRRLLGESRDDRYREWTAELHAILHDPGTGHQARRTVRALAYAAGHTASTRRLARAARGPGGRFAGISSGRLTPAAIMISAAGTIIGIAILIWSPAQQELASWIFVASMTVAVVFSLRRIEWGELRRLRGASMARASRTRRSRYRAAHAGRRKRVLFVRDNWLLFASAAELIIGFAAGVALQIWSPYQGLSSAILASSLTISLTLGWQARRRERPRTQ